jgi:hypothetical protein
VKRWRCLVDLEVIRTLASLRATEVRALVVVLDGIRERPFAGDTEVEDIERRWMYVRVHGLFAVIYYEDHAVRNLVITHVRRLPRRR